MKEVIIKIFASSIFISLFLPHIVSLLQCLLSSITIIIIPVSSSTEYRLFRKILAVNNYIVLCEISCLLIARNILARGLCYQLWNSRNSTKTVQSSRMYLLY